MYNKKYPVVAQTEHAYHEHEQYRINLTFCNVTRGEYMPLMAYVTYIWALRTDGQLVLGVEKLHKHPQLIKAMGLYKQIVPKSHKLGHPTLAYDGVDYCDISIAGELYWLMDGRWCMNNDSGRYGVLKRFTTAEVYHLMNTAKKVFHKAIGLNPVIQLMHRGRDSHAKSLRKIQRQAASEWRISPAPIT
tara:strand:- start:21771 stop:22337 length:567 start_codon:yes stop_codon:yes gene_type:complete